MLKRNKQIKLAQTLEGLHLQAEQFLEDAGFGVTDNNKKLFAAFIQHYPQDQDTIDPDLVARMMRKAKANELAFYMMHPDKAPKEDKDESETISKTTTEVV